MTKPSEESRSAMPEETKPSAEREHCHAGSDGDCWWKDCPQEANNRADYQPYCPLAKLDDAETEETC